MSGLNYSLSQANVRLGGPKASKIAGNGIILILLAMLLQDKQIG